MNTRFFRLVLAGIWVSQVLPALGQSFDTLLSDAVRYGSTLEKRAKKEAARKELFAREPESLRYIMTQVHLENVMVPVLAEEMVEHMKAEQSTPVLLEFLGSKQPRTRKLAAYWLGFHKTPEYADRLLPLLADDEACGAAIRTLGKWAVRSAVTNIVPFLSDEKEVRRVSAANALRDIGDPAAVLYLLPLLRDPFFTVREVAARALSALGPEAERALIKALPSAEEPARRHIIRTLGAMKSRRAVSSLRRLLRSSDPLIVFDAQNALRLIRDQPR